jgi:hypothetical protein
MDMKGEKWFDEKYFKHLRDEAAKKGIQGTRNQTLWCDFCLVE